MAVEGNSAYRQSLMRQQKTREDIAAMRQRQQKDPLRWAKTSDPKDLINTLKRSGLTPEQYGFMLDEGFRQGMALEKSMSSPAGVDIKINYAPGRALQGMMASTGGAGRSAEAPLGARQQDYSKQPLPETATLFNEYVAPYRERGEGFGLKEILKAVKDDPRGAYESTLLAALSEAGRVSGKGEDLQEFIKEYGNVPIPIPGMAGIAAPGIRKGTTMAMREEFTRPATLMDYISVASYATPGSALKGLKFAGTGAKATASLAKAKPRTVAGLGTGGALAAYTLSEGAEDADAASLSLFAYLLENFGERAARTYARKQARSITSRHRERVFMRETGRWRGPDDPKGPGWWKPFEDVGGGDKVTTDQAFNSLMDWYRAAKRGDEVALKIMNEPFENTDALHWGHRTPLIKGGLASEGRFISGETNLAAGARQQRAHIERVAKELNIPYKEAKRRLKYI